LTGFSVESAAAPQWKVTSSARTHIGLVRAVNEDRILNRADRGLWAIADGMGGYSRGDVAADAVIHALALLANGAGSVTADQLCTALRDVNRLVHTFPLDSTGHSGSTVAGLQISGQQAFYFWAGDSRIYRHRQGRLEAMTHDHRVVQEMIDAGVLDVGAARAHPRASVITRAIGAQPTLALALLHDSVECGDTYLLCSDGLTDLVEDERLARILRLTPVDAADALLNAALLAGGRDNVSLIVVGVRQRGEINLAWSGPQVQATRS